MEPLVEASPLTASKAVTICGYAAIAIGLNQLGEKAPNFNPTQQDYEAICKKDDYQLLLDKDFLKKFTVLYNIQVKEKDNNFYYFGFIAQDKSSKDYVVAFRGTQNELEKNADEEDAPVEFKEFKNFSQVPKGFYSIFEGGQVVSVNGEGTFKVSLSEFATNLKNYLDLGTDGKRQITVTGHSLGSALATYFAAVASFRQMKDINILLCTFASPKTGDAVFTGDVNDDLAQSYRFYNTEDVVPDSPVWNGADKKNIYTHINYGKELSSKGNKYIKPGAACAHQLPVYIYLLKELDHKGDPNIIGAGGHKDCQVQQ